MKPLFSSCAVCAVACSLVTMCAVSLRAQTPAPEATPVPAATVTPAASPAPSATPDADAGKSKHDLKQEAKKEKHEEAFKERMSTLTPEEKEKFLSARKAAMKTPEVEALAADKKSDPKAYNKAVKDAMLKADPSLQAIFDKMHGAKKDS